MGRKANLLFLGTVLAVLCAQQASAWTADEAKTASTTKLSVTDTYLDLGTGKEFKILYDDLNDIYNRNDLFALELYVNTRTRDTFWLEDAILINNALLKDEGGNYRVDPNKVKRDGNTYKVKANFAQGASRPAATPTAKAGPAAAAPAPKAVPVRTTAPAAVTTQPAAVVPASAAPALSTPPPAIAPAVVAPAPVAAPAEQPAVQAVPATSTTVETAKEPAFIQMELPPNVQSSQNTAAPVNESQMDATK